MKAKKMLGAMTVAVLTMGGVMALAEPGFEPQAGMPGDRPQGGPGRGPLSMGQGHQGPMGQHSMGSCDPERAKKAGATDEQIQKIEAIQLDQQSKRIDLQAAAEKAELKLRTLMKSEKTDEKALLQAADEVNQARGELFKLELSTLCKTKQILGDAVMKKMREMGPPSHMMGPGMPGARGGQEKPGVPPPEGAGVALPEQK